MSSKEPSNDEAQQLTLLLQRAADGDHAATNEILPLVYDQLKRVAQVRMVNERKDHTLQATALVHETYAKLMGQHEQAWANRRHFFFAATQSMRQILIDHARTRNRHKRGGPAIRKFSLDIAAVADLAQEDKFDEVIALDEALHRLESERPRVAQVVSLRFFGGLTVQETADMLGVAKRTIDLDWVYARAWLYRELSGDDHKTDNPL
jgi:RNA polymerase sigma factor (TIGR02999 family)